MACLRDYVDWHLHLTAQLDGSTPSRMRDLETWLRRASHFFGAERELSSITVRDVRAFEDWLHRLPSGRGGKVPGISIEYHLSALSDLYRRANRERRVPAGYDPVRNLVSQRSNGGRRAVEDVGNGLIRG